MFLYLRATVLVVGVMGSLYLGWATPTEAAALGCLLVPAIAAVWGRLRRADMVDAVRATVLVSGNILFIIFAAFVFSYAISLGGVGEKLTQWMVSLQLSKLGFLLALFALFTVLGALVESLGIIVITVPLLYPVLISYGIDPVWFGIVLVLFIEMGQITPPIGINLFVIQGLWRGKLADVVLGTVPFHLLMFVMVALLMMWPQIALWLPQQMTGR